MFDFGVFLFTEKCRQLSMHVPFLFVHGCFFFHFLSLLFLFLFLFFPFSAGAGLSFSLFAMGRRINKFSCLAASVPVALSSGLVYSFVIWGGALGARYGLTRKQVDMIGSAGNLSGLSAFAAGRIYDSLGGRHHVGPRLVLLLGICIGVAGYVGLYVAAKGLYAIPYSGLLLLAFLAGTGGTFTDTCVLVTNVRNFPHHRGTAVGVIKACEGLSSSLYATMYAGLIQPLGGPAEFLLLLALGPAAAVFAALPFVNYVPFVQKSELKRGWRSAQKRFFYLLCLLCMVALYIAAAALAESRGLVPQAWRTTVALGALVLLAPLVLFPARAGSLLARPARREHFAAAAAAAIIRGEDPSTAPLLAEAVAEGRLEPGEGERIAEIVVREHAPGLCVPGLAIQGDDAAKKRDAPGNALGNGLPRKDSHDAAPTRSITPKGGTAAPAHSSTSATATSTPRAVSNSNSNSNSATPLRPPSVPPSSCPAPHPSSSDSLPSTSAQLWSSGSLSPRAAQALSSGPHRLPLGRQASDAISAIEGASTPARDELPRQAVIAAVAARELAGKDAALGPGSRTSSKPASTDGGLSPKRGGISSPRPQGAQGAAVGSASGPALRPASARGGSPLPGSSQASGRKTPAASSASPQARSASAFLEPSEAFPEYGDVSLAPGAPPASSPPSSQAAALELSPDLTPSQSVLTAEFWIMYFVFGAVFSLGLTIVNNADELVRALGGPASDAPPLVSLFGVASFAGRLAFGYVPEKALRSYGVPRPRFLILIGVAATASQLCVAVTSRAALFGVVLLAGLSFGGVWSLLPAIASELFGLSHFASNYSLLQTSTALGGYVITGWLAGSLMDASETCRGNACFATAFLVNAILGVATIAAAWTLDRRTRTIFAQEFTQLHRYDVALDDERGERDGDGEDDDEDDEYEYEYDDDDDDDEEEEARE